MHSFYNNDDVCVWFFLSMCTRTFYRKKNASIINFEISSLQEIGSSWYFSEVKIENF